MNAMNAIPQAPCTCKNCPGEGCACGCQTIPAQQAAASTACPCGPQCKCGPGCACTRK